MSPWNRIYHHQRPRPLAALAAIGLVALLGVFGVLVSGHGPVVASRVETALAGMPVAWPAPMTSLAAKIKSRVLRIPPGVAALDRDTEAYNAQIATLGSAPECFPVHIRDTARIGILYLNCSDESIAKDAESVDLSENFKVPEGIARRFNFWRRIYSLWGKDQWVMHLSEFPEVVLEAYDVSRVGDGVGPIQREVMVKRVAKAQRAAYRELFLAMYRQRKDESTFSPAMKRLARAMAHIRNGDKYLIAARTLRLQRGQRDFIAAGLMTAPRYLPAIEREFAEQGVPIELTRLPFIESSFNLMAHSKVGASGVFQIMPATGRQYLKMHSGLDERNDPIKASRAAAKLLKLNYELTGSWPLAITAYNHGVGGIRRATHAVGSNDIVDLINKYYGNAFGFASKNFYAGFLAIYATLKESDRLFPEVPKVEPLVFDNVRLTKPASIAELRKRFNISTADIRDYNPDITRPVLRANGVLPRGYVLKVPSRAKTAQAGLTPPNT
jgi:membrane-bound lytic murein transglycosylase D